MTTAERIRTCRQARGLSQEKVAELVGVSRQAVTKWERGQSAPSTDNLFRLAEIFGTTVDLLVGAGPAIQPQSPGQAGAPHQGAERAGAGAGGIRRTGNLAAAGGLLLLYLAVYLLVQLAWGDRGGSSVLGLLFSDNSPWYLWGWLLRNRLYWAALCIAVIPTLLGKGRFGAATTALFFLGILAGEWFGPYPAGAPYGHSHDGWAIWGGIYLVSLVMGILLERMRGRGIPLRGRKGALWLGVTLGCCGAVVLLVVLSRPSYG